MSPTRLTNRPSTSKVAVAAGSCALALAAVAAGAAQAGPAPAGVHRHSAAPTAAHRPARAVAVAGRDPAVQAAAVSAAVIGIPKHGRHHPPPGRHHRRHHRHRLQHAGTPQQIAWQMLPVLGWRARDQFRYLHWLWDVESHWQVHAMNPYSGAYGIPQALPGSKMASAGPDWQNSARTQIRWGLRYIRAVYGSPQLAWQHEQAYGWY